MQTPTKTANREDLTRYLLEELDLLREGKITPQHAMAVAKLAERIIANEMLNIVSMIRLTEEQRQDIKYLGDGK